MEEVVKVDAELTPIDYETFFAVATRRAFMGKAVRVRSGLMFVVSVALLVSLISIVQSFFPGAPFL